MEKKSMMLTVLYPLVRAQLTITFFWNLSMCDPSGTKENIYCLY